MKIDIAVGEKHVQVGLDRMVIGFPPPKPPKHDAQNPPSQELLAHMDAQKKQFVSHMKHIETMAKLGPHFVQKIKGANLQRISVKSDDGEILFTITLGFSYSTPVINIELNPSKISHDKWEELLDLLSVMFNGHYYELYSRGVVSHAEFFVDVIGENLSGLVLIDTGRRIHTNYKGTTYHGGRYSRLVGVLYDKAKELGVGGQLVRFEVRLNRRDMQFGYLVETPPPNPLSNFLVVHVNQLQSVANEWNNPKLANHIKELGLYGAVKNKHAREAILAKLQENAVPWWKPDLFWAAHRELLLKFKPGQVGGVAPQTPPPLLEIATL